MVKNPHANAGDTSSIPGPGRFHMLRGDKTHAPHLLSLGALSLCSATKVTTMRSLSIAARE